MSPTEQPAEQVEASLPESAKEETKEQFEKLLEHNRQMAQRLEKLEKQQQPQFNSVLDEVNPPSQALKNLSTTQVADITAGLVDENGYIDQDLLNKTLLKAQKEAQEAKDRAMLAEQRIEKFEETQIVRDVHSKHPQLDPYNSQFNPDFYEAVKQETLRQLKRGYQDFAAAADKVNSEFRAKAQEAQRAQVAKQEEQKKVISQREQAGVTTSRGFTPSASYEDLETGTRKGDALSIGQRLQRSGY